MLSSGRMVRLSTCYCFLLLSFSAIGANTLLSENQKHSCLPWAKKIRYDSDYLSIHFARFRENIVGQRQSILTPYGEFSAYYFDWAATGRLYGPIEKTLLNLVYPLNANTHSDANYMGSMMTRAYTHARSRIKKHVDANDDDILILAGSGMTGAINKLQSILGLKVSRQFPRLDSLPEHQRPVVLVSHMEHHSNEVSWRETIADVVVIKPDKKGQIDLDDLERKLEELRPRSMIIVAVTAASNVTGVITPIHEIARLTHRAGGKIVVDYTAAAPYLRMNMHPEALDGALDAIMFSPHKFLGGPGSTGVLIMSRSMYASGSPDNPGGGTVKWVNPWGEHSFLDDPELREDGGTPPVIQTIRTALALALKNEMSVMWIQEQEEKLMKQLWIRLASIPNLHILEPHQKHRLPFVSFYIDGLHYDLGVRLLNDLYGIQARGGCSCAGPYGHYLLNIDQKTSENITRRISSGDDSVKPGWIRVSLHPTHTMEDIDYLASALEYIATQHELISHDYIQLEHSGAHVHKTQQALDRSQKHKEVEAWFESLISTVTGQP